MINEADVSEWHNNLSSRVGDARVAIHALYSTTVAKNDAAILDARNKSFMSIDGLSYFYGSDRVPHEISNLRSAVDNFIRNTNNPECAHDLFRKLERLPDILIRRKEAGAFDRIFNEAKDNGELNSLMEAVIERLKELLRDGSDTLTASLVDELKTIIGELERRKHFSLNEWMMWIEAGGGILLHIAGLITGNSLYGAFASTLSATKTAVEAAQSAVKKAKAWMLSWHDTATTKALESKGLMKTNLGLEHQGSDAAVIEHQPSETNDARES